MTKLVLVLAFAFVGASSYAKGGNCSGDAAKLVETSLKLGSSFSVSGTFTEKGKAPEPATFPVSISGQADGAQVSLATGTYTVRMCGGPGIVTGSFTAEGAKGTVTVRGRHVTIVSKMGSFDGQVK